ncbi:MAG TPA: hypothetical protein V6D34_17365 [Candidatus Sericytochromatia bacterium]
MTTNPLSKSANAAYNDSTNQLARTDHSKIADAYTSCANGDRTNTGYQAGSNNQLLSARTYSYTYDNEENLKTRTKIATGRHGRIPAITATFGKRDEQDAAVCHA